MQPQTVAIDYDETLTRNAPMWRDVIAAHRKHGCRVICVTARRNTPENNEEIDSWMDENQIDIPVFYTSLSSKVEYMKKLDMKVDFWTDDDPRTCALGH